MTMTFTFSGSPVSCHALAVALAGVLSSHLLGCAGDVDAASGLEVEEDVAVTVEAASPYSTSPCTTIKADYRFSLGTGPIPAKTWNSPNATYGQPGCERLFVVEIANTYGNYHDLYLAANWALPLPTVKWQCEVSWVRYKSFGQYETGQWFEVANKTVFAHWEDHNCVWPNDDWGPETFVFYTPGHLYKTLRMAVQAGFGEAIQGKAQVYLWPT